MRGRPLRGCRSLVSCGNSALRRKCARFASKCAAAQVCSLVRCCAVRWRECAGAVR